MVVCHDCRTEAFADDTCSYCFLALRDAGALVRPALQMKMCTVNLVAELR